VARIPFMRRTADAKFAFALRQLRKHVDECYECKGAIAAHTPRSLCKTSMDLVLFLMQYVQIMWDVQRGAWGNPDGWCYVCPEPDVHGKTFAATKQPVYVTVRQDRLF